MIPDIKTLVQQKVAAVGPGVATLGASLLPTLPSLVERFTKTPQTAGATTPPPKAAPAPTPVTPPSSPVPAAKPAAAAPAPTPPAPAPKNVVTPGAMNPQAGGQQLVQGESTAQLFTPKDNTFWGGARDPKQVEAWSKTLAPDVAKQYEADWTKGNVGLDPKSAVPYGPNAAYAMQAKQQVMSQIPTEGVTPENYANAFGAAMNMAKSTDPAMQRVGADLVAELHQKWTGSGLTKDWKAGGDEWKRWNNELLPNAVAPPGSDNRKVWGFDAPGAAVGAKIQQEMANVVNQRAVAVGKGLEEGLKDGKDGGGIWNNIMKALGNDPMALLVPAGLIAMAFGGDAGKVLGVLAIGAGGYNLYDRYQNLTGNPKVQEAIQKAATFVDPKSGKPAPMSEDSFRAVTQLYTPEEQAAIQRGLYDYRLLAAVAPEYMKKMTMQAGRDFQTGMFGPDAQLGALAPPTPAPAG